MRDERRHPPTPRLRRIPLETRLHIPVLETTVLERLALSSGEVVLDCTLGLGGHAAGFLKAIGPDGILYGIDADRRNLDDARALLAPFGDRVRLLHANFGDIAVLGLPLADLVFADLGVSSPHFDDPERGMSFRSDGPLDLRFDRESGMSAADRLAGATEHELVYMLRAYGEVRDVRKLIALIRAQPPVTTKQLVAQVEEAYGWKAPKLLPQIFQALRIWVNDEVGALERLLAHLPSMVKPGGRVGIITYHSLEDRPVKHAFRSFATPVKDPVTGRSSAPAHWEVPDPKGIIPSEDEIARNPRARSARLRILRRLAS